MSKVGANRSLGPRLALRDRQERRGNGVGIGGQLSAAVGTGLVANGDRTQPERRRGHPRDFAREERLFTADSVCI